MESQMVKRRVNIIAGHLAAGTEDVSAIATHIFPMSCSNSPSTVIQRRDNKMFFARQGSIVQPRQVSTEQVTNLLNPTAYQWRRDNKIFFARQASSAQGFFMRQISNQQGRNSQPDIPLKTLDGAIKADNSSEAPVISTPAQVEPVIESVKEQESVVKSEPEAPISVKPNLVGESKWSPRMDVGESGRSYVILLELPGVYVDDIRVEVNEQSLIVSGNRSASQISKVKSCSNDSIATFHQKEIFLGPYQVVWSLPSNANKDKVSADFANGILKVTIPKLSETSNKVIKANM